MNFKKYMGKDSRRVTVWHVSPIENIYKLKPTGRNSGTQAVKQGQAGIYVAPSFRDCVKWWVSYVAGTKTKKLRKIGGYPRGDNDKQFSYEYDEANIYEIEIPKNILDKCWYSNDWEKEFFVPEEYIPQLRIVSSKKYKSSELLKIYKKDENKKMNDWGAREKRKMIAAAKSSEPIRLYFYFKEKLANYMLRGKYTKDSLLISNIEKSLIDLRKIATYRDQDSIFRQSYKTEFSLEEKREIDRIRNYLNSIFN
jgi:hypothetical protein